MKRSIHFTYRSSQAVQIPELELLYSTELGDQRLMQLLHHMQQLLGDHAVDTNGPLLHELFLQEGGRVFLHMLSQKQGKVYKLTKPFNGSIRIMEMFENGANIRVIDNPNHLSVPQSPEMLPKADTYQNKDSRPKPDMR